MQFPDTSITQTVPFGYLNPPSIDNGIAVALFQLPEGFSVLYILHKKTGKSLQKNGYRFMIFLKFHMHIAQLGFCALNLGIACGLHGKYRGIRCRLSLCICCAVQQSRGKGRAGGQAAALRRRGNLLHGMAGKPGGWAPYERSARSGIVPQRLLQYVWELQGILAAGQASAKLRGSLQNP